MRRGIAGAFVGLIIGITSQASVADTFDAVADFNNTGDQPAVGDPFTYGTETSLNAGFALFPNFQAGGTCSVGSGQCTSDGTLANYYFSQPISGPAVGKVATGGPLNFDNFFTVPTNVLVMMPGEPDLGTPEIVVTRFTAPTDGLFNITGSFTDLESASVSLAVLVNGATAFSAGLPANKGATSFSINDVFLAQGMTVDFTIDSLGNRADDVLGLTAQITGTETPVPAALPLFATGLGAMGLLGWRRRRRG